MGSEKHKHPIPPGDIRRQPRGFDMDKYTKDPIGSAVMYESNHRAAYESAMKHLGREATSPLVVVTTVMEDTNHQLKSA